MPGSDSLCPSLPQLLPRDRPSESRLAINTLIYNGHDLHTTLAEIRRIGCTAVEYAFIKTYAPDLTESYFTERQACHLRDALAEHALTGPSLSAHMDLGAEDAVDAFKRRMVFAKALGAGCIISNTARRTHQRTFFRNMETLAAYAGSLGILICLENAGDGEAWLIDSARTGGQIVQQIGSQHVKLNYDIGNVFINTKGARKPEDEIADAVLHAAHFHLKDIQDDNAGYSYCAIGSGLIDYRRILQILAACAPLVPIAIEIPLQLRRGRDFVPWVEPAKVQLPLARKVLQDSLDFVRKWRSPADTPALERADS